MTCARWTIALLVLLGAAPAQAAEETDLHHRPVAAMGETARQMNISAIEFDHTIGQMHEAGVTPVPSVKVKPPASPKAR